MTDALDKLKAAQSAQDDGQDTEQVDEPVDKEVVDPVDPEPPLADAEPEPEASEPAKYPSAPMAATSLKIGQLILHAGHTFRVQTVPTAKPEVAGVAMAHSSDLAQPRLTLHPWSKFQLAHPDTRFGAHSAVQSGGTHTGNMLGNR